MNKAGIATADYYEVSSVEQTLKAAQNFSAPFVLKADGLAAGKGVFICEDEGELRQAAQSIFVDKILGAAGERAILERFQAGWELSYLILTNGTEYEALPLAQDHKRLHDGDRGPNTGGMGVVAPLPIDTELHTAIREQVMAPLMKALSTSGFVYRGVLYVGLMITENGPSVLEFNVRFGDPEAQVLLPLLDGDWGQVLHSVALGKMQPLKWKPLHTACVVLAAPGYPEAPRRGVEIQGDPLDSTSSSYFLHAGTARDAKGRWITDGGRVLNAIGIGSTLTEAVRNAYRQAEMARWAGLQMRRDIGQKVLAAKVVTDAGHSR